MSPYSCDVYPSEKYHISVTRTEKTLTRKWCEISNKIDPL